MGKIKHWDEYSQSWVIDGASNASNLELTNPGFVDENGNSISIDRGFTKAYNRITKLEKNLAWLYLNGTGGGGGGTGGDGETYTIELVDGETVYTSTDSVNVRIRIISGTTPRTFTIVAKNVLTGATLGTWQKVSLSTVTLNFSGLNGTTEIELSAYDGNANYTIPSYVTIISGAIRLTVDNKPTIIDRGAPGKVNVTYTILNNISGSLSSFILKKNNVEVSNITNITTSPRTLIYDIRQLIFIDGETIDTGQKFTFSATASTTLNGATIYSNTESFTVSVSESNSLIIITDEISEFEPTQIVGETYADLKGYSKNSQLAFNYYLSYSPATYTQFRIIYSIYLMENGEKISDTPIVTNAIDSNYLIVSKSTNNVFSISTINDFDVNLDQQYLMVELSASAVSDPNDISAKYTKRVYCKITEAISADLYANNDIHTLLAYYSKVTGFPSETSTSWLYNVDEGGAFPYEDIFIDQFPNNKVELKLVGTNGINSGFRLNSDSINNIPAIVLPGESYGYIKVAEQMFPNYEIGSGYGFFQDKGFNISLTYKSEVSSDPSEVVMSLGKYANGELVSGMEISLEKVIVQIGSADSIESKLPQGELLTIDIDVSKQGDSAWYFKIYVNGVLSAVTRVLKEYIDWKFAKDLYLSCRDNNGVRSNFSNTSFYDIKIYTSSQSEYAITQNYISATEQASLIFGEIDPTLDNILRTKNFFDSEGKCLIWNYDLNSFYDGEALYSKLVQQMSVNTPYPLLFIEETSTSSTNLEAYSNAVFPASDKDIIMGAKFPCKLTFRSELGSTIITTPNGVDLSNGVRIGLQGTSSLSYNAKNYELYLGDMNVSGKKLLFQPIEDWLPENEFTLKADVMDSAHVNNVVIGKIINGAVKNQLNEDIKPLGVTPPMLESSVPEEIRAKMKHTSDGFSCLVFIKFAPDETGHRNVKFCGIYNFNLGRYAFHNLGLTLLTSYSRDTLLGPSLISDYTEDVTKWNTSSTDGAYSIEINQNNSAQGAFQQDNRDIIEFMADVAYSSQDKSRAYDKVGQFYTRMANMVTTTIPKYTMDDAGQTPTKLINGFATQLWDEKSTYNLNEYVYTNNKITYKSLKNGNTSQLSVTNDWENLGEIGTYYTFDNNYWQFSALDNYLNWDNGCAYFMIALIFGMVDSMCKNLTLRNWGGNNVWYPSFYDMDTAFGLNNAGQDIVEYWAHIHRYFNVAATDTGITSTSIEKNYPPVNNSDTKQYFSSWWNRIWEVLETLPNRDANVGDRTTLEKMYVKLRTNLFPDPEEFIDMYYKSYTDSTGSIIFNYDYKVKYLKIEQTYDVVNGYTDTTNFSQLRFLHGNRVMHVKDWFKKRIQFLDGVYGITNDNVMLPIGIASPITESWINNRAVGTGGSNVKFSTTMAATSKILHQWSYNNIKGKFWLDSEDIQPVIPLPSGDIVVTLYANKNITKFGNFKDYVWTSLPQIDLPLLEDLDLSGLTIPNGSFFNGGIYDPNNNVGLRSIRNLNLSGVKVTGTGVYNLDASHCEKLQSLNISNSNITSITLPDSAVLKYYNLSGTNITELNLQNQAFLNTLIIDNCLKLTKITLTNCGALTNLVIPQNVIEINVIDCKQLSGLTIRYNSINNSISSLINVNIDNCPELKTFDISGQNNPNLQVNLVGATNLEILNLSYIKTTNITLPSISNGFNSLKSIDISHTDIYKFNYNDGSVEYLDLIYFPDLDYINANTCTKLTKLVCTNNIDNPINLYTGAFYGCNTLTTMHGHFNICGSGVFRGCSSLKINTIYPNGTASFQSGDSVMNISFSNELTNLISCFEGCSSLSYDDFKYIMPRLNSTVTSIEAFFKGCSGINGAIMYDLFRNCPNIVVIKEAFRGCKLTGPFYSRSVNYSELDSQTWGILDFISNITDAESAFENTYLEWIDNRLFEPIENKYSSLVNVDNMFRGCVNLKSCEDTRAITPISGTLLSETFFTNLRNLIKIYPSNVFSGCGDVRMTVSEDVNGNTLLFHVIEQPLESIILTNSLYDGIKLIGNIKENVFGSITKTLPNYYIPTFTSIQYPFNTGNNLLFMELSNMGNIFSGLGDTLLQAIGVFKGVKCINDETSIIPSNIFQNCTKLNSIENLFADLNLTNNKQPYLFPDNGLFDDCTSLQVTRNLFSNCNNLKIKLIGEGFKNCQLTDVSGMFSNSGLYDVIPYRLFFMRTENQDGSKSIKRSITNMSGLFSGCWCLGYDIDREIDVDTILRPNVTTQWSNHVVKTEGTKVSFKLDVSQMVKSYNYDLNTDIASEDYNPGIDAFDIWYLDGYAWDNATAFNSSEQSELDIVKNRLYQRYFSYDVTQQSVISQLNLDRYIDTNQNYMIPTDLFRYCNKTCTLSDVLLDLNWFENTLLLDPQTNYYSIETTSNIEGLTGRIPMRLFNSLVDSTEFNGVFKNTRFDAFVGLQGSSLTRGIMYPPDLFKYNIALINISNMFMNTTIPVGVDINSDLFLNLSELKNVSSCWYDCYFDKRPYKADSFLDEQLTAKQIAFNNIFANNVKITNASSLFGVSQQTSPTKGLFFIEDTLLQTCYNMNNISGMFYLNSQMKGNVPRFQSSVYPVLNIVSGYLHGCSEGNITNSSLLESRLRPSDWSQI